MIDRETLFRAWMDKEHPYMKNITHPQKMAISRLRKAFFNAQDILMVQLEKEAEQAQIRMVKNGFDVVIPESWGKHKLEQVRLDTARGIFKEIEDNCIEHGIAQNEEGYIRKPFSLAKFTEIKEKYLNNKKE